MHEDKKPDPAFPECNEANVNGAMGMTLRDYFAAKALCGISGDEDATNTMSHNKMAEWAYRQADAMLEARKQ